MIDDKKFQKSTLVDINLKQEKHKEDYILAKYTDEYAKQIRIDERERKRYRRQMQTREVQKRMKKNERIAKRNTKNKPNVSFCVLVEWEMKKLYGRLH